MLTADASPKRRRQPQLDIIHSFILSDHLIISYHNAKGRVDLMTGTVHPEAKTPRLIIAARNECERLLIQKLKRILAVDQEFVNDLFIPFIQQVVDARSPSNPQTQFEPTSLIGCTLSNSQKEYLESEAAIEKIQKTPESKPPPDYSSMTDEHLLERYYSPFTDIFDKNLIVMVLRDKRGFNIEDLQHAKRLRRPQ